jgi:hypothetical protein
MTGAATDLNQRVEAFWLEVRAAFVASADLCFATRASQVQSEGRNCLQVLGQRCEELKQEAIQAQDENAANALLSIEFMLRAVFNELSMWIALKDDDAQQAWHCLIVAQGAVRCALKAHRLGEGVLPYADRLLRIERTVFPPQTFLSSAFLVERYDCSVCGKEYGQCDHLVGRPYMGELCSKIPRKIKNLREIAIMLDADPVDKRCRMVTRRNGNGEERDTLTGLIVPPDPSKEDSTLEPEHEYGGQCLVLCEDQEPGI